MEKFWMVVVDGTEATAKRYFDLESAKGGAERLAQKEGKGVTVLEAVEYCKPGGVVWE